MSEQYELVLCHHGIEGQKWHKRNGPPYPLDYNDHSAAEKKHLSSGDKVKELNKKFVKTAVVATTAAGAVAGTAAITQQLITNKSFRDLVIQKGSSFVKKNASAVAKNTKESVKRAGKSMTDAALASVGSIAIAKLSEKLRTNNNDPESTKLINKVMLDSASAGINTVTRRNNGNNNNNNNRKHNVTIDHQITDKLGSPSGHKMDLSTPEWSRLINSLNNNNEKNYLRTLAKQDYGREQLEQYVNLVNSGVIKHSDDLNQNEEFLDDELTHHGIEGQKWHKRNGPPYPLDYNDHSAAEKKHISKGKSNEPTVEKKTTVSSSGDYQTTVHKIKYTNNSDNDSKKNLDKLAEDDDYDTARKFEKAVSRYSQNIKSGEEYARKVLHEELKDYSYELRSTNEKYIKGEYAGEEYTSYFIKVEGNKYSFNSIGNGSYFDDQYFDVRR